VGVQDSALRALETTGGPRLRGIILCCSESLGWMCNRVQRIRSCRP
jgi:hypothetical protein